MVSLLLGLLQQLALWILAILLLGAEYLDWFGRLEVLEMKHPKVHRFINSRQLRLVLLVLLFAILATDLRTTIKEANTEPLVVKADNSLGGQACQECGNSATPATTQYIDTSRTSEFAKEKNSAVGGGNRQVLERSTAATRRPTQQSGDRRRKEAGPTVGAILARQACSIRFA